MPHYTQLTVKGLRDELETFGEPDDLAVIAVQTIDGSIVIGTAVRFIDKNDAWDPSYGDWILEDDDGVLEGDD